LLTANIGEKYFVKHPDYNYVFRNCGDYVEAMLKVIDPALQMKKKAGARSLIEGVVGLNETEIL